MMQFLQQINVQHVHLESRAGIRSHDLLIMSLLPWPLDPFTAFSTIAYN